MHRFKGVVIPQAYMRRAGNAVAVSGNLPGGDEEARRVGMQGHAVNDGLESWLLIIIKAFDCGSHDAAMCSRITS